RQPTARRPRTPRRRAAGDAHARRHRARSNRRADGGQPARRTPEGGSRLGSVAVEPLNVWEYERAAAELLEPGADGYFVGGAGDEVTLAENVAAYRRLTLRPRVLVDVADPSTATTVLGRDVSLPVLVAPVAYQRVAHPDGEVATARAAAAVGTIMCLSTFATATFADVAAAGGPRWFQLYVPRDPGVGAETIAAAAAHGFEALVVTV